MRTKKIERNEKGSNFDLSISDLMAALCCIFVIFLVLTIEKLNKERKLFKSKNLIATEYRLKQKDLYDALYSEFQNDLEKWEAELEMNQGVIKIRFTKDSMMFLPNRYEITNDFKDVLADFFPRLIGIIGNSDFYESIQELRIEGHTAAVAGADVNDDYVAGMNLSQERTKQVLLYCLQNSNLPFAFIGSEESVQWVRKKIVAIGYSNSIPAKDIKKSRRVEFSIRTTAENVIDEIEKDIQK